MHYFAGLDIGTTHTKLIVVDQELQPLFQQKIGYVNGFGAQLDAGEILQNCIRLIEAARSALSLDQNSCTLCFSAAMHSLVLVDELGSPLTPLYTWADIQSQSVMDRLKADPIAVSLFAKTGTPLHPMAPLCKLVWLQTQDPRLFKLAHKFVGIKELVWFHFTQTWEIDQSLASATGLFNLETLNWHPDALQIAGIDPSRLSKPVPITRTFQSGHIELVIGASDGCLAQLGSGAMLPGTAALTIGTSGAIRICLSQPWVDPKKELFTYLLDEAHFVCGGSTNNGGIVLQWWENQVMENPGDADKVVHDFIRIAAAARPGCDGMICLPYFGGERAPVWNAAATGKIVGITTRHGQPEFYRAILEGIGYSFRQLLDKLEAASGEVDTIYASGGFTKADWWVQLMADILMKPLFIPEKEADASAMGAIAVAMKAAGRIASWDELRSLLQVPLKRFDPSSAAKDIYLSGYQVFTSLCLS